jgi:hypothetical protein
MLSVPAWLAVVKRFRQVAVPAPAGLPGRAAQAHGHDW